MPKVKSKLTVVSVDSEDNPSYDSDMSESILNVKPKAKRRKILKKPEEILNTTVFSPKNLRSKTQSRPKKGIAPTAAQSGAQSDGDIFDSDGKKTFFYLF